MEWIKPCYDFLFYFRILNIVSFINLGLSDPKLLPFLKFQNQQCSFSNFTFSFSIHQRSPFTFLTVSSLPYCEQPAPSIKHCSHFSYYFDLTFKLPACYRNFQELYLCKILTCMFSWVFCLLPPGYISFNLPLW